MSNYEVIVIGGGAAGASILYSLARKGVHRTLLMDRGTLASGSTGKSAAMIRVFHQSSALTTLAAESLPHYLKFEKEVGYECGFKATGSLYFEPTSRLSELHGTLERLRRLGHRIEILDKKAGEARFPQIAWPERCFAIYEPDAGYADPVATTKAWVRRAVTLGADCRESVRVREILVHDGKVQGVVTDQGEFRSSVVIVAAGAWTSELLAPLGVKAPLESKSLQIQRFRGERPRGLHPIFFDHDTHSYGRPDGDSATMVGSSSAISTQGLLREAAADPGETRRVRQLASRTVRGIAKCRLTGAFRVHEAYTADGRGLMAEVGSAAGLLVAAGFSGTGFKIAPSIGKRMAVMAEKRLEHRK